VSGRAADRGVYLAAFLQPLRPWLERSDVTDILINVPGEVWVETLGGPSERHEAPDLTDTALWRLAGQIAAYAHQGVSRESPLLSAALPDGARVQVIAPPATRGALAMAIRKHVVSDLTLEDYVSTGAFAGARASGLLEPAADDLRLQSELDAGRIPAFLRAAVLARKNILVSGGTSTGKTTFLNALLKEVPPEERLILIEDAPEIRLDRANWIGLLSPRGELGEAQVSMEDLLQASLRMRPDRIILGELRGREAYSFLRAVNSGHPGSITTVHADNPRSAVDQIVLMIMQSGIGLGRREILDYVAASVEVAVQLNRVDGKRVVSEVAFNPRGRA
jgi:type IV secretion system protein VirB11